MPCHPWKRLREEEELYDITADPNEQNNLAEDSRYDDEPAVLRELLEEYMKETGDPYLGSPIPRDFNLDEYQPVEEGIKYW